MGLGAKANRRRRRWAAHLRHMEAVCWKLLENLSVEKRSAGKMPSAFEVCRVELFGPVMVFFGGVLSMLLVQHTPIYTHLTRDNDPWNEKSLL